MRREGRAGGRERMHQALVSSQIAALSPALLCIAPPVHVTKVTDAASAFVRGQANELAILHTIVRSKGFVWIANHPNSAFHWSQAGGQHSTQRTAHSAHTT